MRIGPVWIESDRMGWYGMVWGRMQATELGVC